MAWRLFNGKFRERVHTCWVEIKENLGRSTMQTLAVILGVASVLGGFSITDSHRRAVEKQILKMGGMDKLQVKPVPPSESGSMTALQMADLGLRNKDAEDAKLLEEAEGVEGMAVVKRSKARVLNAYVDQERSVTGSNEDYLAMENFSIALGRGLSKEDVASSAPVTVLGSEAAAAFFPQGGALGQTFKLGTKHVKVIGVLHERVFRFEKGGENFFKHQNTLVLVPITFLQKRMLGDAYERVDNIIFKIPDMDDMSNFAEKLTMLLVRNHRQQENFRIDDVAKRMRKVESQNSMYELIFMLSGLLAILGGGIVNINIQLASLKERVREIGVKMAIGAGGTEIFKEFMTEAMLITTLSALIGLGVGLAFSYFITDFIRVKLYLDTTSFVVAFLLALICGFLFALYPAWKASRQSPMEALRYE